MSQINDLRAEHEYLVSQLRDTVKPERRLFILEELQRVKNKLREVGGERRATRWTGVSRRS